MLTLAVCTLFYIHISLNSHKNSREQVVRKLWLREVRSLAQGRVSREWQRKESNPGLTSSRVHGLHHYADVNN